MKNTITPERLEELKNLVGKWATANFDVYHPDLGLVEEVGEAAHCILKRAQGIRGFDNHDFFISKLKDAVADVAIYGLHLAYIVKLDFTEGLYLVDEDIEDGMTGAKYLIGRLSENAALCLNDSPDFVLEVMAYADALSAHHGINFGEAVEETWAKVCQRNWRVNPGDADAKAEQAA